jgi:prevent-host-death family protein
METVSISEFKATCLERLAKVNATGEPLLITKRGKPLAQVTPPPLPEKKKSWLGCGIGTIKTNGDIVAPAFDQNDFADMYAEWDEFYGK